MRNVTSNQLTAGLLSSNFNEKIKEFIASDQAFTFMNNIKGTPAYWKKNFVLSFSHGETVGCVKNFHDTFIC